MDKITPRPKLIAFEVTRRCRFSCRHCRAIAGPDHNEKNLTTEQCKRILKAVADFNKCAIIITGGEPMERKDIYQLIEYGRDLDLKMVMATCGYLLDAESMTKLKAAGIEALSFSLDGASAESHDKFRDYKGAFDSVIKAARTARSTGMPFQINTTISKRNADEFVGIAELAKRLGAHLFNPFILVPTGRADNLNDLVLDPVEYESVLNELLDMKLSSQIKLRVTCGPQLPRLVRQSGAEKRISDVNGCIGGRGFGFISYCGDVQTCGFLNVSAGNLLENNYDFGEIWLKSKFLEEIRDTANYTGKCAVCEFVGLCGGCRARAFAASGDYLDLDPVCDYKPERGN